VTRRLLHFASMVLLAAVTVVSTARVLCLLPCFTAEAAAEVAGHCAHATSADVDRLSAQPDGCGDCEPGGIESADRLPPPQTVTGPHAVTALTLLQPALTVPATRTNVASPAPPRGPSPGRAPVPLRI
jgi:hypothetical protein